MITKNPIADMILAEVSNLCIRVYDALGLIPKTEWRCEKPNGAHMPWTTEQTAREEKRISEFFTKPCRVVSRTLYPQPHLYKQDSWELQEILESKGYFVAVGGGGIMITKPGVKAYGDTNKAEFGDNLGAALVVSAAKILGIYNKENVEYGGDNDAGAA